MTETQLKLDYLGKESECTVLQPKCKGEEYATHWRLLQQGSLTVSQAYYCHNVHLILSDRFPPLCGNNGYS